MTIFAKTCHIWNTEFFLFYCSCCNHLLVLMLMLLIREIQQTVTIHFETNLHPILFIYRISYSHTLWQICKLHFWSCP